VIQSTGCQQTSSHDVPKFVVTSTDEISADYCHRRRHCSDTSSFSTQNSPLISPLVVS